ncbi:MAG: hypothetical protein R3324_13240 [Halobacteriales archaeon]|nr:hypothetical protein [Halobacteriales archaeon]
MPQEDNEVEPVPLDGSTLITGPSNVGKTRLTARTLAAWVDTYGPSGVVVLEFGPEVERDGRILGGRITRFEPIPDGVFYGVLEAHAPRAQAEKAEEALELARDNATRADRLLSNAPTDPRAVFVNDTTIAFQHPDGSLDPFLSYCDRAECAVLNAFESDELGTDDPISTRERDVLNRLKAWADRVIALPNGT